MPPSISNYPNSNIQLSRRTNSPKLSPTARSSGFSFSERLEPFRSLASSFRGAADIGYRRDRIRIGEVDARKRAAGHRPHLGEESRIGHVHRVAAAVQVQFNRIGIEPRKQFLEIRKNAGGKCTARVFAQELRAFA